MAAQAIPEGHLLGLEAAVRGEEVRLAAIADRLVKRGLLAILLFSPVIALFL